MTKGLALLPLLVSLVIPVGAAGAETAGCNGPAGVEIRVTDAHVELHETAGSSADARHGVVTCDVAGFEPLDIVIDERTELPLVVALSPIAARTLLHSDAGTPEDQQLMVRWYGVSRGEHRLLATRLWQPADPIPFAGGSRIIRVSHPVHGQFSFVPRDGEPVEAAWSFRDVAVLLPAGEILPTHFNKGTGTIPLVEEGNFVAGFIPVNEGEKTISLRPRYTGGITGDEVRVNVQADGDLWLLAEDLEEVGGVRITADDFICADLQGASVSVRKSNVIRGDPMARVVMTADCQPVIDGLAAAEYSFALIDQERTLATGQGVVEPWRRLLLPLERNEVEVWGRVTAGRGTAVGGLIVTAGSEEVETAEDGSFRMDLPNAGDWRFALYEPLRIPVHSADETLTAGVNRVEFDLGAILEIDITGEGAADSEKAVQVSLDGEYEMRGGFVFIERYPHRTRFFLEPGRYEVHATSGSLRSEKKKVEIGSDEASEYVHLELRHRPAVLHVFDDRGDVVRRATVHAGTNLVEQSADGSYELSGVAEGDPVYVYGEGRLPVCRIFRGANLQVIARQPASSILIQLPENSTPGHLSILGGSVGDCPVPLHYFPHVQREPGVMEVQLDPGSYVLRYRGTPRTRFEAPGPVVTVGD